MEGLQPLHRRVAGIDVHRMLHVVTVLIEHSDGSIEQFSREFGGFRRDCRALAQWLAELRVERRQRGELGVQRSGIEHRRTPQFVGRVQRRHGGVLSGLKLVHKLSPSRKPIA